MPDWARTLLAHLREVIRAAAPEATERMAYGMPAFFLKKNLVGFAAHKEHCALYLFSGDFTAEHADWFDGFKTSKGGVQFTVEKPLPDELIEWIVKARIEEIRGED